MKKQYTITIEVEEHSEPEAFERIKEAFINSSSFNQVKYRVDSFYLEEYFDADLPELTPEQKTIFDKEMEDLRKRYN